MKKKGVNRRNFLRLTATTVGAGALFSGNAVASTLNNTSLNVETPKFPVRTLGRTGIKIPILSMGVMRADNPNVVRAAYNSGIFHFDTANGYQNGRNEEMLGNFFKDKPRESFCIATKVKLDYPLKDNFEQDFSERLDVSLKRLQMDYVDVFYAHAYDRVEQVKDKRIAAELKRMKDTGKIRFAGFSTHAHKPELLEAAIDSDIYDVILVSYNFQLANLEATEKAIERAAKAGIGIVVMKSMAGGVEDASGKKKINAQACLKWVWKNENITTIIPGFTNFDEFDECIAAAQNPDINSDEQKYLAGLCGKDSLFCQQCGKCLPQCPEHLPIPDIMRAYMYTYGYKYASLSKETLSELNLSQTACANCTTCSVSCPSGFNVGQKIAAVMPVMKVPNEFLS